MICTAFAFDPATCAHAKGLLWVMVVFAAYLGFSWWEEQRGKIAPTKLQENLGLKGLPIGVFSLVAVAWGALTVVLFAGLFGMIAETIFWRGGSDSALEPRWHLARLAALTTVLGAVVALPITLNRLRLTRVANDTAAESLFNEKFAQASSDLYAQRQVTWTSEDGSEHFNAWQDDIPRRNAAIDRFEGLVKERPSEAERVSRLLSIYVRELSREHPPKPVPETEDIQGIKEWARGLEPVRTDMQSAVQVLGRLANIDGVDVTQLRIDLRSCNLQGFDLQGLVFPKGSQFRGAQMQGSYGGEITMHDVDLRGSGLQGTRLREAKMQRARLLDAKMHGADLIGAEMQGANLLGAQMQGANLSGAKMQGANLADVEAPGANLSDAKLQGATLLRAQMRGCDLGFASMQSADLKSAELRGSYLAGVEMDSATDTWDTVFIGSFIASVDYSTILHLRNDWDNILSDSTVDVPESERPRHWHEGELDGEMGEEIWRAWQRSIGMNPDGSMRTP